MWYIINAYIRNPEMYDNDLVYMMVEADRIDREEAVLLLDSVLYND